MSDREYIMSLTNEELELVPFTVLKWQCSVQGCTRFSRVRDYGCSPFYFWKKKGKRWINLRATILYCGHHWKGHENIPEHDHKLGHGILHLVAND